MEKYRTINPDGLYHVALDQYVDNDWGIARISAELFDIANPERIIRFNDLKNDVIDYRDDDGAYYNHITDDGSKTPSDYVNCLNRQFPRVCPTPILGSELIDFLEKIIGCPREHITPYESGLLCGYNSPDDETLDYFLAGPDGEYYCAIDGDTTDDDLKTIMDEAEQSANDFGYTIWGPRACRVLDKIRDEKIAERENVRRTETFGD